MSSHMPSEQFMSHPDGRNSLGSDIILVDFFITVGAVLRFSNIKDVQKAKRSRARLAYTERDMDTS